MLRTTTIVPTILSRDKQDYRAQLERLNPIAKRFQVDIADESFTSNVTIDITNAWWPKNWQTDLHLMTAKPSEMIDIIIKLNPSLCILHAEAGEDLLSIFAKLKEHGIKVGVALLPSTYPGAVKHYIDAADHVLIFAGQLGVQGVQADLMQMEKIQIIRDLKPDVEIGWDGGANLTNVRALAHADLDIINVGAALSQAENPTKMYDLLTAEVDKSGVVI